MRETTDYSRFTFAPNNRPVSKMHVESLALSIKNYGYLVDRPIKVVDEGNEKFIIIDGQHRFAACRELGEPIHFDVLDQSQTTNYLIATNSAQLSWKPEDFLRVYTSLGNDNYSRLGDFCKSLGCSVSVGVFIAKMAGIESLKGDARAIRTRWKTGEFIFTESDLARLGEFRRQLDEVRLQPLYIRFAKQSAFIRALTKVILHPGYDHARFLRQLEKAPTMLVRTNDVEGYIRLLLEIYNRHYPQASRLEREELGTLTNL